MIQKAIVVTSDINNPNLGELNQLLEDGWKVIHTCSMPSSCAAVGMETHTSKIMPTCLVVIQKD